MKLPIHLVHLYCAANVNVFLQDMNKNLKGQLRFYDAFTVLDASEGELLCSPCPFPSLNSLPYIPTAVCSLTGSVCPVLLLVHDTNPCLSKYDE